jgi:hypothetical protein
MELGIDSRYAVGVLVAITVNFSIAQQAPSPEPPVVCAPAAPARNASSLRSLAGMSVNCSAANYAIPPLNAASAQLGRASLTDSGSRENDAIRAWAQLLATVAWPLVFVVTLLWLGRKRLMDLAKNLRRISGAGFNVEFSSEAASKVQKSVTENLADYVKSADAAYAQQAAIFEIRELLERAVIHTLNQLPSKPSKYRATVHVPDVVYAEYFYQLLNYFPGGGGARRRFSQRRGILGRAWRLNESEGIGDVVAFDPGPPGKPVDLEIALVREWSMTREEVLRWHNEPRVSFVCIVLRGGAQQANAAMPVGVKGKRIAIFYVDSVERNAFGTNEEVAKLVTALEGSPEIADLGTAVNCVMHEMRKGTIDLHIQGE